MSKYLIIEKPTPALDELLERDAGDIPTCRECPDLKCEVKRELLSPNIGMKRCPESSLENVMKSSKEFFRPKTMMVLDTKDGSAELYIGDGSCEEILNEMKPKVEKLFRIIEESKVSLTSLRDLRDVEINEDINSEIISDIMGFSFINANEFKT